MNKQLKSALSIGAAVIATCLTRCTIAVPPPSAMMLAPAPGGTVLMGGRS
jgi:hypothetical protein